MFFFAAPYLLNGLILMYELTETTVINIFLLETFMAIELK